MAEAFAKKHDISASSAGTIPSQEVNPNVVQVMKEKDIDLTSNTPKMLTTEMIEKARLVVTMGCSIDEVCPQPMVAQMQKKMINWHLEDPQGKSIRQVRRIRDNIERKVLELSEENLTMK